MQSAKSEFLKEKKMDDEIHDKVIKTIAETLKVNKAKLNASIGIGDIPDWDSLGHVNVISSIEAAFDVIFDVEEALDCETIGEIIEIISEKILDAT